MSVTSRAPDRRALSKVEFIALIAMMSATVAFSLDSMLPALPKIAEELSPDAPNRAQLIITSFVLGMGIGTLFTGPLSDRFGRKPVVAAGTLLYIMAALGAYLAPTLEGVLLARIVQGLGAAGPRVVALALVRDLYSGRQMAQIVSFSLMVFSLVPALAPTMGYYIIAAAGWRAVFLAFVAFSCVCLLWLSVRQPETLAREKRRALSLGNLWAATVEMFSHPTVRLSIAVQTLGFGILFATLSSTQQVFSERYGQGDNFHLWLGGIAVFAASASLINARLVPRLGMRPIVKATLGAQALMSGLFFVSVWSGILPLNTELWFYAFWTFTVFFQAGLTIGNLNALGMEPMGHIAGMAASIMASVATVGAVVFAIPIGLAYNGTPLPLAAATGLLALMAYWITTKIRRETDA